MRTPLMYPIKHVFRNWKLFTALLIGITLAATFFAGISIKANVAAEETLTNQLRSVVVDMDSQVSANRTNLPLIYRDLTNLEGVKDVNYFASFNSPVKMSSDNYTSYFYPPIISFPNTSRIYDEWIGKPVDGIPKNYTYIMKDSNLEDKVKIGDNIETVLQFTTPKYYNTSSIYLNLTVAGFVELTDKGYALATGYIYSYGDVSYGSYRNDMLIISWENTLMPLWESTLDSTIVNTRFYIDVDRENLISPWNVQASVNKINQIANNVDNKITSHMLYEDSYVYVNNQLGNSLSGYESSISAFLFSFFIVSIPIFFVAWYLGSTVSDVSFNIRRREIGLLSTKGLSSGQIQRMFLTEALVIGVIGGFLGVIGGLILNQYYAGTVNLNTIFSSRLYSTDVMFVTLIFGIILALISVFRSARKASRIPAVEALRNDSSIGHQTHRRIIPIIALILGCYTIIVSLLGVNVPYLFQQWLYEGGNIFLSQLYWVVEYFDLFMRFFGSFFFLWGIATLIIRDSTKFQTVVSKISSVMGDLGALAAKNVRRNPARLTALAFVIALILCLAVQVTGQIASQQDYIQRTVEAQVGADIYVNLANATQGQFVLNQLLLNVSSIQNATVERLLYPTISNFGGITLKTIDPSSWTLAAHYEDNWFSGNNINEIMRLLKTDNSTVVISRSLAKEYDKQLFDTITIDFSSCPRTLKIVGFFGPEPQDNQNEPVIYVDGRGSSISSDSFSGKYSTSISYYYGTYNAPDDCYAPRDLFNVTGADSTIYQLESYTTNILIKLKPGVNGTEVAQQIRDLDLDINTVKSYDEEWRSSTNLQNSATFSSIQTLDIQSFGLIFAVISASVGTCLIALVSLRERNREATLMSVRGLSYRQLVWVFVVESLAIITFAVILGAIVGIVLVYGTVTSTNNITSAFGLVTQRLIYPPDAIATIALYAGLIYASTIGAIIVMSSQYVTKLEKMVRTR